MNIPDKWILLEIIDDKNKSCKRILSSWVGGYLGGDSWKLSSEIINSSVEDSKYEFITETNSIYSCYKNKYGLSRYTTSILEKLQIEAELKNFKIKVLEIL